MVIAFNRLSVITALFTDGKDTGFCFLELPQQPVYGYLDI